MSVCVVFTRAEWRIPPLAAGFLCITPPICVRYAPVVPPVGTTDQGKGGAALCLILGGARVPPPPPPPHPTPLASRGAAAPIERQPIASHPLQFKQT